MKRKKLLTCDIAEELVCGYGPLLEGQERVDRTRSIIFGVKVVGTQSPNRHRVTGASGTVYDTAALESALSRYEGVRVNCDHPDRANPRKDRSARDRLGKLKNARIVGGEIYADLHLIPSHEMTAKIMDSAENEGLNDCFALSHNAIGRGEVRGGKYVVTEIPEVRSVDLVADGGTNRSLFEGTEVKTTLRKLIESRKHLKKLFGRDLLEMPEEMLDAPVSDPPAEEDVDWKQHLVNAISSLVASEDEEDHKLAKKIMDMLKPASGETAVVDEGDDEGEKEEEMKESLERRCTALERELRLRDLCEGENVKLTSVQRKAVALLESENEVKEFIKELKASARQHPRSQSAHTTESRTVSDLPKSPAELRSLFAARN